MRLARLVLGVVAVCVLAGCAESYDVGEAPEPSVGEPLAALRTWDAGRARAWASGDVHALRSLYTPESAAGERDAAMLLRWSERGLRVEGMQTQVLAARVAERSPDRVVLVVTDRLARAVATGRGRRVVLPGDSATTRRVTLRLVGGVWRVASVLPVSAQP
jgi:hypothetical protein